MAEGIEGSRKAGRVVPDLRDGPVQVVPQDGPYESVVLQQHGRRID